mmetsp:Transcript_76109/g.93450  ORF Transcript_76109/g.93450 Transcript_76109/m.93450 type:complete len:390 (+) Transcript_76109:53-1222(+)
MSSKKPPTTLRNRQPRKIANPIISDRIFSLKFNSSKLGIKVRSTDDKIGLFVASVTPDAPIDARDKVVPNTQIVKVNEHNLLNMPFDNAVELFAGLTLPITVTFKLPENAQLNMSTSRRFQNHHHHHHENDEEDDGSCYIACYIILFVVLFMFLCSISLNGFPGIPTSLPSFPKILPNNPQRRFKNQAEFEKWRRERQFNMNSKNDNKTPKKKKKKKKTDGKKKENRKLLNIKDDIINDTRLYLDYNIDLKDVYMGSVHINTDIINEYFKIPHNILDKYMLYVNQNDYKELKRDLVIQCNLKSNETNGFRRDKRNPNDLHTCLDINKNELINGDSKIIKHIDGTELILKGNKWDNNEYKMEGFGFKKNDNTCGDLFIHFNKNCSDIELQ